MSVVVLSVTENASETPMADTIKTGTTLIEEGTLMPESLRFEREPWTPFYTAGEIIRELRKASGKQSKYGSEGNMAHSKIVIDHYDQPRDVGSLPKDDPNGGTGLLGAPECSDGMKLQMKIHSDRSPPSGSRARPRGSACHQEHEYRPRTQPCPVQPSSTQQDTPELGGGHTWWVALFFNGSSSENPAVRVVR